VLRIVEGSVRLDDQPMPEADEVGDIGAEWNLAAELEAVQSAIAQQLPQQPFR